MITRSNPNGVLWTLAISGLLGYRVGAATFPEWQVAVETAQVVARIVTYPLNNPVLIYHQKLWTVLHQVLAVLLRAGYSEQRLSVIVSGVLGMVSAQALAMSVYVLSRDVAVSVVAAAAIAVSRTAEAGVVYPIYLFGSEHTYGIIGLSLMVLIAALFGSGWRRTAAFLLGVAPAVHPSLGAWLGVLVALASLGDLRGAWRDFRPVVPYLLAGGALTALSLAVQLTLVDHTPPVDAAVSHRYLSAFVSGWDVHRQPIDIHRAGVVLNALAMGLAVAWLTAFKAETTDAAKFFLRFIVVSAALGFAVVFVTHLPADAVPSWLLVLMPGRLLNVDALIFPALAVGLIAASGRRNGWRRMIALVTILVLAMTTGSRLWDFIPRRFASGIRPVPEPLIIAALVTVPLACALFVRRRTPTRLPSTTSAVAFALLLVVIVSVWRIPRPRNTYLSDWTNDPLLRLASEADGLLLTGGPLHLIQLRTRRPVLLDGGGLDGLTYALAGAPATERILHDVYGMDFFNPPADAFRTGVVPRETNKLVWESYDEAKWREIKRLYAVSDVLTYNDWTLTIPIAAQDRELRLYKIP